MLVRTALVAFGVLLIAAGWGWWTVPCIAALSVGTVVAIIPERIVVGDDGILLPGRRFVPYSDLADVQVFDRGLKIVLRSGAVLDLVTSSRGHPYSQRDTSRDAMLDDVTARLRGWADAPEIEAVAPLAPATSPAGYRSAMIPEDRLWTMALSPRTTEDARAGAIGALRATLDDRGRRRLCELADACSSPRVHRAIDAVTQGRSQTAARLRS